MSEWRAKLTDSLQPREKSARVKTGVRVFSFFCSVLFCFLILCGGKKSERGSVSAESAEQCRVGCQFQSISARVCPVPMCVHFWLTRLTLLETLWENQAHTAHSPRQSQRHMHLSVGNISHAYQERWDVLGGYLLSHANQIPAIVWGVKNRMHPELYTRGSNWCCNVKRLLWSHFSEEKLDP